MVDGSSTFGDAECRDEACRFEQRVSAIGDIRSFEGSYSHEGREARAREAGQFKGLFYNNGIVYVETFACGAEIETR